MNYTRLIDAIESATVQLQAKAASAVNQALVVRNWLVGAWVVEFEQNGNDRAKYGAKLLENLAADLSKNGIKGLEIRNLRNCRLLYQTYPQIRQTLSAEFTRTLPFPSGPSASTHSADTACRIEPATSTPPEEGNINTPADTNLPAPLPPETLLQLSWSQLLELLRIADPWKRAFYENECLTAAWSVRQLQRQIGSLLYERTGLSTDQETVIDRARTQQTETSITKLIRDPYILEFTGLSERPSYSEEELESALLDHLQRFLLELGHGFCFEARQFRMTEGRKHHRIDLVFYHRRLRCHVLIDLKIRAFQPTDAGQMNFYLNWFKANMLEEGDQPPVGILLCSDKDRTEVEFATAGMDHQLFVSRYLIELPAPEKLRAFLEADREQIESLIPPDKQ